ncbi:MAG: PQQ-like beta-propeller repeat protein [Acidobacteria bacterium]|nr:PQQ-like beta-propeller repeat protein [Acidobacteriota bacterium]
MNITNNEPTLMKPLRLWPGVVAVALQWLIRFGVPPVLPEAYMFAMFSAIALAAIILIWWLFFSRAPWLERFGALALIVVALVATKRVVHPSIENGMMGMMLFIYSIPLMSLALVGSAVASRRLGTRLRRASMVAAILLGCGVMTLVRTGGLSGEGVSDIHWRWTETPEERLLAKAADEPAIPAPPTRAPAAVQTPEAPAEAKADAKAVDKVAAVPAVAVDSDTGADWPGFRGPERDSIIRGIHINTDWAASPPVELWRRPIGPGWSSFAVHGDLVYTQEQRGEGEIVACYKLTSGEPVWRHRDATRFWESNGGAGPRATPTLHNGRVYTLGATGIVNALDARSGAVVWSRNGAADTGAKLPGWGFSGSPLIADDLVIVAASGKLVAYDLATGDPRWFAQTKGGSYSSPHRSTINGVAQILLLTGAGAFSVAPADGTLLWEHAWEGVPIVQPALIGEGDVLITTGDAMGGLGTRRLAVTHGTGGWTVEERWTSTGLKPYFNDYVIHKGHAFGFDGSILASIDLADGKRKWKGGRYGYGQMILLPDQDLLLVLSEGGELALVSASTEKFTELARFPAIEGKTWNHPVLIGDTLLVRNGEEMAAFRLTAAR